MGRSGRFAPPESATPVSIPAVGDFHQSCGTMVPCNKMEHPMRRTLDFPFFLMLAVLAATLLLSEPADAQRAAQLSTGTQAQTYTLTITGVDGNGNTQTGSAPTVTVTVTQ
jgi:hypothetical protein